MSLFQEIRLKYVWAAALTFILGSLAARPGCAMAVQNQQQPGGQIIENIDVIGNRRVPTETIKAHIYTRPGDVYDQAALERDLRSVWNMGFFDNVRIEREQTPKGTWLVHFYVTEKPTIRTVEYHGLSSVSQSDVLDRFHKAKIPLTLDSPYDPTNIMKAKVALQDLLAEHGRQFANITVQVVQVPPSGVAVTFNIKEGPKVKVGRITFKGNNHVSSRKLREAMRNLRPIGIPDSIFLENIFAKTFDASKLQDDAELVHEELQKRGFYKAVVQDPQTQLRDTHHFVHFPFIQSGKGKAMDITVPIDEGDRFKLKAIYFENNKAILNTEGLRRLFPIKDGDTLNTYLIYKGLQNLKDAYGELGYIKFSAVPEPEIDNENKTVAFTINVDEDKPFSVRRIEFEGNTTTRDKVIRRELLVQEGQPFNERLWKISIQRLNQLNYFEQIKPEDDTERKIDEQNGSVDLNVKVKEKGKNSIGLTGGVSGLSGSFIGINYQTNNFLGLGETLTVQADVGSLEQNLMFGFTEPYLFGRSISTGFTVYGRRLDFNQAQQAQLLAGQQLNLPQSVLDQLLNYNQSSKGFTGSINYALPRSFNRIGLTYSYDNTTIKTFNTNSNNLFQNLNFRNLSGPDALKGIVTSSVIPSFGFTRFDNPVRPTTGSSLYLSGEVAGLGGNVNFVRPVAAYTRFFKSFGQNTFGMRFQGSFITGFNGTEAPPFQRFYMGGENDIRGFDIRTISPYVFLNAVSASSLTNPDGSPVPIDPANPRRGFVQIPVPVNSISLPGGDTSLVTNFEYRLHLVGPVTLAPFMDMGMNFIVRPSQLKLNADSLTQLNTTFFGCPGIANFQCAGGQQLQFSPNLTPVPGTNYVPRMSTGLELQVLLPIIQQPFRIYYAYNPLILNTTVSGVNQITRSMFPPGAAGDFSFQQTQALFPTTFRLEEPRHTFRFTISTTF